MINGPNRVHLALDTDWWHFNAASVGHMCSSSKKKLEKKKS